MRASASGRPPLSRNKVKRPSVLTGETLRGFAARQNRFRQRREPKNLH
jgi:hypothetical protein